MQTLVVACGVEFPDQGSNPDPVHGQHGVLATGPQEVPALSYSKECLSQTSRFSFDEVQLIKFFL